MQPSQWKEIVDGVEKDIIPLEFVDRVTFYDPQYQEPKSINISDMRKEGISEGDIQDFVFDLMLEYIETADFILNIGAIAMAVGQETNKLLKNM